MREFFEQSAVLKPRPPGPSKTDARPQDVFVLVAGTVVFLAPWFNGDTVHPHGAFVAQCVGALICSVALLGIGRPGSVLARYLEAVLGLSLLAAPFYTRGVALQYATCVVLGLLVCGLAFSTFLERRSESRRT